LALVAHFRGDHSLVSFASERFADGGFIFTVFVNVRGVKKINAQVYGMVQESKCFLFVFGKRHTAKANRRDV
jgi:hypothetical protein